MTSTSGVDKKINSITAKTDNKGR